MLRVTTGQPLYKCLWARQIQAQEAGCPQVAQEYRLHGAGHGLPHSTGAGLCAQPARAAASEVDLRMYTWGSGLVELTLPAGGFKFSPLQDLQDVL